MDKNDVAAQVEQLTEEQKEKIVKVGKTAVILQLLGAIPGFILLLGGLFVMINWESYLRYDQVDKFFFGFMTLIVLIMVYVLGILLFVKIRYPYYSDAKCKYIMKMKKNNLK